MKDPRPMSNESCTWVRAAAAELALDVLSGDERAAMLAHLDDCPACRDLVDDLSRAADDMLTVLPPGEVPPELEDSIRADARSATRSANGGGRARQMPAVAAPVAIAAGALVLDVRSADAPEPSDGTGQLALVTPDGDPVGRVEITGDEQPRITMTVDDGDGDTVLRCIVTLEDGTRSDIGYVRLRDGEGAWTGDLDHEPAAITAAELVDDAGHVAATATID